MRELPGVYQGLLICLVLSREWGNGLWRLVLGIVRDYYRDPFPHSLLYISTKQSFVLLGIGLHRGPITTINIIRNHQNSIGNYLGPYIR